MTLLGRLRRSENTVDETENTHQTIPIITSVQDITNMTEEQKLIQEQINTLLIQNEQQARGLDVSIGLCSEAAIAWYARGARETIHIDGGIGLDDNMSARHDFLYTLDTAIFKLRNRNYGISEIIIISNILVKHAAESGNNIFRGAFPTTELRIIEQRRDVVEWRVDNNLPNVLLFMNISHSPQEPIALIRTGMLTVEAPTHNIGHYDVDSPVIPDKSIIITNKAMGYRNCWMCNRQMNFRECVDANSKMDIRELMKSWKHKAIEIACCNCSNKLKMITENTIREIIIKSSETQVYRVREDRLLDKVTNITKVIITFDRYMDHSIELGRRQFRALLEKHIIDVPIELEGANHA